MDACRLCAAACCAHLLGRLLRPVGIPLVLTYIVAGIALGPAALALVPDAAALSTHLSLVRGMALAFIGLVSAAEFVLRDIERPRAIVAGALRVLLLCVLVVAPGVYAAGALGYPWLAGLSGSARLAVALVLAVLASTPGASVVVAVVSELKAAGDFTRTVMQCVIVSSVAVIVAFTVAVSAARAVLQGELALADLANLVVQLCLPVVVGFAVAAVLRLAFVPRAVLTRAGRIHRGSRYRIRTALRLAALALVTAIPWLVNCALAAAVDLGTGGTGTAGISLSADSMLSAIVGGFIVTNYTTKYQQLTQVLNVAKPVVFLFFFTMTGATLDLSVLRQSWSVLPLLFVLRITALLLAFVLEPRSRFPLRVRALAWMGYVGQGGVIVSLAAQLATCLGDLGRTMAAITLSLLVVNTLLGPALFKFAVKRVHEDAKRCDRLTMDLVGCGPKPLLFARRLVRSGWNVHILDVDPQRLRAAQSDHAALLAGEAELAGAANAVRWDVIPRVSPTSLRSVGVGRSDSLVCALDDDDSNYAVVQAATALGLTRVLVHLANPANAARFLDLHVLIMDMTSALVEFANIAACDTAARDFARSPLLINDHLAQSIHAEDILVRDDDSDSDSDSDFDDDENGQQGQGVADGPSSPRALGSVLSPRCPLSSSQRGFSLSTADLPAPVVAGTATTTTTTMAASYGTMGSRRHHAGSLSAARGDDVRVFPVGPTQVGKRLTELDWPLSVCVRAVIRGTRWMESSAAIVLAAGDAVVMTGHPAALVDYARQQQQQQQQPSQSPGDDPHTDAVIPIPNQ